MSVLNNLEVGKRVEHIAKLYSLKIRKFALAVNSDPSYIAKVIKGDKPLSRKSLDQIVRRFRVNENWLITGEGSIFTTGMNYPNDEMLAQQLGTNQLLGEEQLVFEKQLDWVKESKLFSDIAPQNRKEKQPEKPTVISLERENVRLKKDLDFSLGELRHNILLTRAISETNQELLIEILAGKNKKMYERLADIASIRNGEKYKRMKEEDSSVYSDR